MLFHQKGALKKHSTQTLEQVRTAMFFSSCDRGHMQVHYYQIKVKSTPQDYIHELESMIILLLNPLVIFLELLEDSYSKDM